MELASGDFLPKRDGETRCSALCVCFVAILRARNVGGRSCEAHRKTYLAERSLGERCSRAAGSARRKGPGALQGCLIAVAGTSSFGEWHKRRAEYLLRDTIQLSPSAFFWTFTPPTATFTQQPSTYNKFRALPPRHNNKLAQSSTTTTPHPRRPAQPQQWLSSDQRPLRRAALPPATLAKTSRFLKASFHQTAYPTCSSRP